MSVLNSLNFNANEVQPSVGFEPIPVGTYSAIIESAVEKPTKTPGGVYLEVAFKLLDGAVAGRKVFSRFNLVNKNPQAVQIARGELSAMCRACGLLTPKFPHEFANRMLRVGVKLERRSDDPTKMSNSVSSYEPPAGQQVAPVPMPQTQPMPQAGQAPQGAPWAR